MDPLSVVEAVVGGALVFVLPGAAVAKAVFPERRVRGPDGVRWALELAALALVLSVVLTVVVGAVLLSVAPGGFAASWSDPLLEAVLAAITAVAFVAAAAQGAFRSVPPPTRPSAEEPGSEAPWELADALGRLQRERKGLERDLARLGTADTALGERLRGRLARIGEEEATLRERREADYDL